MKCSGCNNNNDRAPHRYCRACHATYQRQWRRARNEEFRALLEIVTRETSEVRP